MDTELIGTIGSFGTFIVAIVALGLVLRQIFQIERQIQGSSCSSLYEQMILIDQFFINNPDYKPFIYSNKNIEHNEKNYDKIRSIAEMISDMIEHAYVQKNNLPKDVWPRWVDYFSYLYDSSPILRQHLHESGKWYSDNILLIIGKTGRISNK